MKKCGIYKITSPSGKVYIGQSVDIDRRWKRYRYLDCKGQSRLYRSFMKHGVSKHKFEILCQCDRSELNNLEKHYVSLYESFNNENGLNLHSGGNAHIASDETRKKIGDAFRGKKLTQEHIDKIKKFHSNRSKEHNEKISKALKGKIVSDETRKKLSIINSGENNPKFGTKHSEETRLKISLANKGKKRTDEMRKRTSELLRGRKMSDEFKSKVSERMKGHKFNVGKKHSEEHKLLIAKSLRKPILQINNNGETIREWDCLDSVIKELQYSRTGILKCCQGRSDKYKDFSWVYK